MMEQAAALPADPILGVQPRLLTLGEAPLAVPLLLALSTPVPTTDLHEHITDWLCVEPGEGRHRGIMTLRSLDNVIVALFFFALRVEAGLARLLHVPCLRVAEPTGRHALLGAALRTIVAVGDAMRCRETLIGAEATGVAWLENAAGLRRIGHAHGFAPRGADWVRTLADELDAG
jgi:hypothetical protein